MLIRTIICALILSSTLLHGETSEYAEIDTQIEIIDKLLAGAGSTDLSEQIGSNMGEYNPAVLAILAECQLFRGEVELAAQTFCRSIFRAAIDIRMSQDRSLEGVPSLLMMRMGGALEELGISTSRFADAFEAAVPEAQEWELNTPRLYDRRWASSHSMGAFSGAPLNYLPESELNAIQKEEFAKLPTNN